MKSKFRSKIEVGNKNEDAQPDRDLRVFNSTKAGN